MINENEIFELVELLRNGALVTGSGSHTQLYRQRCLESAYHMLCTGIVPEMIGYGLVKSNARWESILDVGALFQKGSIRPEMSGARPAFP